MSAVDDVVACSPAGLPVKCSCDSNHSIDSPVSLMVVWCSTFSLMGLVGAFYIIVATASVAWQLRVGAPQKLSPYLHDSAGLIVVLALGTGLGSVVRFMGAMNTAFWGTFWASSLDRETECFVSAHIMQVCV